MIQFISIQLDRIGLSVNRTLIYVFTVADNMHFAIWVSISFEALFFLYTRPISLSLSFAYSFIKIRYKFADESSLCATVTCFGLIDNIILAGIFSDSLANSLRNADCIYLLLLFYTYQHHAHGWLARTIFLSVCFDIGILNSLLISDAFIPIRPIIIMVAETGFMLHRF